MFAHKVVSLVLGVTLLTIAFALTPSQLAPTAASTVAQGSPLTELSSGPSTLFLPFVTNGSGSSATSFELIEQALERGEIDEETALVYKVFAFYMDPRLPERFIGDDSHVRDSMITSDVGARWSSLSPATQTLLAPFLLPPAAPGSWLELQQEQAATARQAEPIEWVTLSRPGGKTKVWYQTRYPGDDAIAARVLADLEDEVWGPLTELMDHGPLPDDGLPNNGGDGLFDVYIVRLNADGAAPAYEPICAERPSYLLINGATKALPATIVHEFMHAIIWATPLMSCEWPEYRWLNEATATWAEDFISTSYDTQQDEQAYAKYFLNFPENPLQILGANHEYGAYLWPFYLARTYSPQIIPTIWTATASKNSLAAINGAISDGFLKRWPEFAKLNLNQEPVDDYNHWDGLTNGALTDDIDGKIDSGVEKTIDLWAEVPALAAYYYRVAAFDATVTKVRYENSSRFISGAEPRAKVEALIKIEGQPWTTEDWTRLPNREFCRTKPGERIEALMIILSNSEWEDRDDELDPGTPAPLLRFSTLLCSCEDLAQVQNWTGQVNFSFTTSASSGDESMSYQHSATVNLQMAPDYQISDYIGWKDVSLDGTGEVNDIHTEPESIETLVGGGALYPGGPNQDDPKARLGVWLSTCTFEFYLQTGMSAQYRMVTPDYEETFDVSTGVGIMDINDIPISELTGSRTVPAVWYPIDEPSWFVPASVFDSDLELMVGNNFGEATISWSFEPAEGAVYLLGQTVNTDFACQDEAGGSDLASCVGDVPNGSPMDTDSIGAKTFTAIVADEANNSASVTDTYHVIFNFTGFASLVDNPSFMSIAKAGQTIPLKWHITDANGNKEKIIKTESQNPTFVSISVFVNLAIIFAVLLFTCYQQIARCFAQSIRISLGNPIFGAGLVFLAFTPEPAGKVTIEIF